MSKVLKWLEEESNRLTEEYHSNHDPYKTVNNSFLEGFNYAVVNVEALEQPQLNENQQASINEAKKCYRKGTDLYDCSIDMLICDGLQDKEWAEATVAFLTWALEQEEE